MQNVQKGQSQESPATRAGISMIGEEIWSCPELASELSLLSLDIIRAATAAYGEYPKTWRIDAERWSRIADALGVVEFRVLGVPVVPDSGEMIVWGWGYGPAQLHHLTPQMAKLLGLVQGSKGDRLMAAVRDVARGQ